MLNSRRQLLQAGAGLLLVGPVAHPLQALAQTPVCDDSPTPRQIEGPFYTPQTPKRSDLTSGLSGQVLVLEGRVLNTQCQPIANAIVDLWGCDAQGNYDNKGFKLRGHQFTDSQGRFRFQTIKPGAYGNSSFRRTPHLHVKVQGQGTPLLTTQLYFPDEPLNQQDGFYNPALLVQIGESKAQTVLASFDFVLPARSEG
ncbi:dioxygenase family protein [Limnobacter parvus]|uniref:Intradiol ring-cleavage dioxygenase n=1 Tax=Limnobacter parvus TaxID=2939690 RepID=A0ABT1XE19_9BURK|nr:intradiol ring-cleavage dioxygenase [Limnobacter parvus]MCR2745537.1 intradiol ring-cleavage dioxygenase [Limnobacter parvus]